ncbi:MAG: hypothetical protein QXW98_04275 [Candidatus Caldarchaeum sp.]
MEHRKYWDSLLIELSLIGSFYSGLTKLAQSDSSDSVFSLSDTRSSGEIIPKTIPEILDAVNTMKIKPGERAVFRLTSPPEVSAYIDTFLDSYLKENPQLKPQLDFLRNKAQKHVLAFVLSNLPKEQWSSYLERVFKSIGENPDYYPRLQGMPKHNLVNLEYPILHSENILGWTTARPSFLAKGDARHLLNLGSDISLSFPALRYLNPEERKIEGLQALIHELGHTIDPNVTYPLLQYDSSELYQKAVPSEWRDYVLDKLTIKGGWITRKEGGKWYFQMPNGVSVFIASPDAKEEDVIMQLNTIRRLVESDEVDVRVIELARFDSTVTAPKYIGPRSLVAFIAKANERALNGTKRPVYYIVGSYIVPRAVVDPKIKTPDAVEFADIIADIKLNLAAFNVILARDLYYGNTEGFAKMLSSFLSSRYSKLIRGLPLDNPGVPFMDLHEVIATAFDTYMLEQIRTGKPILSFEDFVQAIYRMQHVDTSTYPRIRNMLIAESKDILGIGGKKMDYRNSLLYFLWRTFFSGFAKNLNRATLERIKGLA